VTAPSRALSALFGVALLGVLLAGGLFAATLGGPVLLAVYAVAAVVLLGLGVARVRRLARDSAPPPRACTCCDGDHLKPIEVV
jgi:hypothetical protein